MVEGAGATAGGGMAATEEEEEADCCVGWLEWRAAKRGEWRVAWTSLEGRPKGDVGLLRKSSMDSLEAPGSVAMVNCRW